jgi:hypothetical protein
VLAFGLTSRRGGVAASRELEHRRGVVTVMIRLRYLEYEMTYGGACVLSVLPMALEKKGGGLLREAEFTSILDPHGICSIHTNPKPRRTMEVRLFVTLHCPACVHVCVNVWTVLV